MSYHSLRSSKAMASVSCVLAVDLL